MFVAFELKKAMKLVPALLAFLLLITVFGLTRDARPTSADAGEHILVLDPGHGGIDGGAVSADGHKESDINLAIALKTEALADFVGVRTVLTRNEDTDGTANGTYSERQNLLNRVELINSVPNGVLVSIHQNVYPSEKIRGAEVMYAKTSGSARLALVLQEKLVSQLDPENRRVARPAPEELLLTSEINCTGVLAELGFLSNPEEAARLSDGSYQSRIAAIILSAFIDFTKPQLVI